MGGLEGLVFLSLLCHGYSLPVGSSPENKLRDVDWWSTGQKKLEDNLKVGLQSMGLAKNVILFVGDGMGVSTVTAARVFKAQSEGGTLQDTTLAWEDFPFTSLSKTYNVDQITPDSAGTATAILTGVKTNAGLVSVSQETIQGICSTTGKRLKSILKYANDDGKWTGIVSTARITHATPAAAYATSADRAWEADSDIPDSEKDCKDIARQLVEDNDFIRIIFGGGRRNFLPKTESDPEYPDYGTDRTDGRNLMKEWEEKQAEKVSSRDTVKLVINNTGFRSIAAEKAEYVLGLFEPSHMQYVLDRDNSSAGEPSLVEMVEKAITMLKRNDKGYFLLVEGGRIDLAHHGNKAHKALAETVAMSAAVQKAVDMTSEADTLITVTADHSHVFTFGGYQAPTSDILGISLSVKDGTKDELEVNLPPDGLPWLPLAYANGPGYEYHRENETTGDLLTPRRDLTEDFITGKTRDKDYRNDAGVYRSSETHGAEEVAVYARGPMSHLFRGTHEQTYIGHVLMYASCLGENKKHCTDPWVYPGCEASVSGAGGLDVTMVKGLCSVFVSLAVLRRLQY